MAFFIPFILHTPFQTCNTSYIEMLRVQIDVDGQSILDASPERVRGCLRVTVVLAGLFVAGLASLCAEGDAYEPVATAQLRRLPMGVNEPHVAIASQSDSARHVARADTVSASLYRTASRRIASWLPEEYFHTPTPPPPSPLQNLTSPGMPVDAYNRTKPVCKKNLLYSSLWYDPQCNGGSLRLTTVRPFTHNRKHHFAYDSYVAVVWPMLEVPGRQEARHRGVPVNMEGTQDWEQRTADVVVGTVTSVAETVDRTTTAVFFEAIQNQGVVVLLRIYTTTLREFGHVGDGGWANLRTCGGPEHCVELTLPGSLTVSVSEWVRGDTCLSVGRLEDTAAIRTICFHRDREDGRLLWKEDSVGLDGVYCASGAMPYIQPLVLHATPAEMENAPLFVVAAGLHDAAQGEPPIGEQSLESADNEASPIQVTHPDYAVGMLLIHTQPAKWREERKTTVFSERAKREAAKLPKRWVKLFRQLSTISAGWHNAQADTPAYLSRVPSQTRQAKASSPTRRSIALTLHDDTLVIYDLHPDPIPERDPTITKSVFSNVALQGVFPVKSLSRRLLAYINSWRRASYSKTCARPMKAQFSSKGRYLTVMTKTSVQVYRKRSVEEGVFQAALRQTMATLCVWCEQDEPPPTWELGWRLPRERTDVGLGRPLDTIDATALENDAADDQLLLLYEHGVVVSYALSTPGAEKAFAGSAACGGVSPRHSLASLLESSRACLLRCEWNVSEEQGGGGWYERPMRWLTGQVPQSGIIPGGGALDRFLFVPLMLLSVPFVVLASQ